jgi:hypothetical protein
MANPETLAKLLKKGVAEWNRWKESSFPVNPDLSEADLRYLSEENLSEENLSEADLYMLGFLRRADLREAVIT